MSLVPGPNPHGDLQIAGGHSSLWPFTSLQVRRPFSSMLAMALPLGRLMMLAMYVHKNHQIQKVNVLPSKQISQNTFKC